MGPSRAIGDVRGSSTGLSFAFSIGLGGNLCVAVGLVRYRDVIVCGLRVRRCSYSREGGIKWTCMDREG